ncbi:hypothetical protein PC0204_13120 [Streptococcus pneumoniae]|nr:hypothetical protein PC0204_13120 [Streptococcus pneumoniae]
MKRFSKSIILDSNQKALYNSDMKSTKEEIQTIKTLLKDSRTAKYHKRLQIVLFRLMGKSYKEIIELLDCNQTTIWRNVKKYEEFGLDSLLQETRGGRNHAYMTVEEEKAFLARHLKATEAGEFVTIDALFQAYIVPTHVMPSINC